MKVLIVENNETTLKYLGEILGKEGFETVQLADGKQAISAFSKHKPDFVCLDIVMPEITGYDICREIRKTDATTPIVFISSKSEPFDKVLGLELGADDYITKPFDINEVIARIRAVARRCIQNQAQQKIETSFQMTDLQVFPNKLKAQRGDNIIDLSLREIKILQLLHDHKNEIVHRDTLLDYCWGSHIMPESRTVDWHISQLRKRVEADPKNAVIIKTVHGVGYKFEE